MKVYQKNKDDFCGIYAGSFCNEGSVVYTLTDTIKLLNPTRTSIRIQENMHVEDEIGRYINHSCYPTCKIDGLNVVAVKDIQQDQEITFNYTENEDFMASPFKCKCCDRIIKGNKQ